MEHVASCTISGFLSVSNKINYFISWELWKFYALCQMSSHLYIFVSSKLKPQFVGVLYVSV